MERETRIELATNSLEGGISADCMSVTGYVRSPKCAPIGIGSADDGGFVLVLSFSNHRPSAFAMDRARSAHSVLQYSPGIRAASLHSP